MTGVENANTLHSVPQASLSLPQEEEEREQLRLEVSCHRMESIIANILVKRLPWSSTMDPAIALTLRAGTSPMFLLLALPSISHKGN